MSEGSLFSTRMANMSEAELKKYVDNKDDFQDYAVLTAILELEKRGVYVENGDTIKQELTILENEKEEEFSSFTDNSYTATSNVPSLYSVQSIFIFGALFSVFGGSILMVLNLFQLNKRNSGWYVIIGAIIYSYALSYIYTFLNLTDKVTITSTASFDDVFTALIISLVSNVIGVYLLYHFIWKKEVPSDLNYKTRSIKKPIVIILAINLLAAILLIASGNFPM